MIRILQARLHGIDPRRRPRYRPHERRDVLWHGARYALSAAALARTLVLSVTTVLAWRAAWAADAVRKAAAPANRLPALVGDLARYLKREWPRWGSRRIAGVLVRLGVQASPSSVQRALRRKPRRHRAVAAARRVRGGRPSLVPRFPGHVFFVDSTRLGGFLRSVVVGAVIDGFSRKVLALRVAPHEPTALFAVRLLREAVVAHGQPPECVVSDHGRQSTADAFESWVRRQGTRHRLGAVHTPAAVARLERFWGSLKREFARALFLFHPLARIERDLRSYVAWANTERPHPGIGQQTPADVHEGRPAREPRRLTRGVLDVRLLDGHRELPVLRLRDAA